MDCKDFFSNVTTGYTFSDVLLVPAYSELTSRKYVDLSTSLTDTIKFDIPIVSSNMTTVTEMDMIRAMAKCGGTGVLHRYIADNRFEQMIDSMGWYLQGKNYGISVGVHPDQYKPFLDVATNLSTKKIGYVVIDIAHGHLSLMIEAIKNIKKGYPELPIVAGNVCTVGGFIALADAGATAVKVGVGPGGVCSTRVVTGCGYPQLSAVKNIADYRDKHYERDVKLIADGGIKTSGDIVKSLAAGADFVMLGSLLAGTDESPGDVIQTPDGKKYKKYAGMASLEEQVNFFGKNPEDVSVEGVSTFVEYKGPVQSVINKLINGVKSGFSYCGCKNIEEMHDYGRNPESWVIMTQNGKIESAPHF